MTDTEQGSFELPGLDLGPGTGAAPGHLRAAVTATIEALHRDNLLEARHVALCQLALVLADSVESATRQTKAYAVAQSAAQLRETLAALPAPSSAAGEARLVEFIGLLREAGKNDSSS